MNSTKISSVFCQYFKMPKDLKSCDNQISRRARRSCHHPYNNSEKTILDGSSEGVDLDAQKKEWDNAVCLICLEQPHNAVLLLCSSYDKGCRPYMCDTSSRHSNCLDQYRKPRANCRNMSSEGIEVYVDHGQVEVSGSRAHASLDVANLDGPRRMGRSLSGSWISRSGESAISHNRSALHGLSDLQADRNRDVVRDIAVTEGETSSINIRPDRSGTIEILVNDSVELKCPLCRGEVKGWQITEAARKYLNSKPRSCSYESCTFSGTYRDLRKHARSVHPTVRPADVDPARQRAWRDSELSREFEDMLSTIRSAMPNAIVLGDYVIDNEDGIHVDHDEDSDTLSTTSGSWWTRFFLFHMFGPIAALTDGRRFSARWRAPRRQRNAAEILSGQSVLWGENGVDNDDEELDNASVFNSAPGSRRRRRSNGFRLDDDIL